MHVSLCAFVHFMVGLALNTRVSVVIQRQTVVPVGLCVSGRGRTGIVLLYLSETRHKFFFLARLKSQVAQKEGGTVFLS